VADLEALTLKLAQMTIESTDHQESTNPPLLIASVGDMCPSHKPNLKDNYVQWHDWAESQAEKGIKQTQCEKCKRWFFPSEF
jgi:hypothetical protein